MSEQNRLRIAIAGASGYTGAELVRLLVNRDDVEIVALGAERKAGQTLGEVFPHLAGAAARCNLPELQAADAIDWDGVDVAFFGLPHGAAHPLAQVMPAHVRIIDLSPDFRLTDPEVYAQWYGLPHRAPELQPEAVYGLCELARDCIKSARIVANPGCYPTASLLPLVPLVVDGLIDADDIVIDAKSGVSGAGRAAKETSLYAEVAEGIQPYGVARHRHAPEIEQLVSRAAGRPITLNFTPHLMPMNRGILASIYVRLSPTASVDDLREGLGRWYQGEPFVRVLPDGGVPSTRHVRGSNHCLIGVFADRIPGRAILLSVIDNLVKGAAGQAIQNMNLVCGLPETTGLTQEPLFP